MLLIITAHKQRKHLVMNWDGLYTACGLIHAIIKARRSRDHFRVIIANFAADLRYFPVLNVAEGGQVVHYQYVEPLQMHVQSLAVSELPGYPGYIKATCAWRKRISQLSYCAQSPLRRRFILQWTSLWSVPLKSLLRLLLLRNGLLEMSTPHGSYKYSHSFFLTSV